MTEAWAAISGYEGKYEVSTYGNVRAFHHTAKLGPRIRVLKPRGRYKSVTLYGRQFNEPTKTEHRVHRLVAKTFIPSGCVGCDVHHEDWERTNNFLANLSWLSKPEHRAVTR